MLDHTAFIGRAQECDDVRELLEQPGCRLLSLVGPGGIGKTRLALQVGALSSSGFEHGVVVVRLQPLRSAELFVPAIADACGISLAGSDPPIEQLGRYLQARQALVILDNFEHLPDAADQLALLLGATPRLKYLVTSREALHLEEEWLYPVPGLAFPDSAGPQLAGAHDDAVQLFNERARRVYPDFAAEQEVASVIEVCRLVGGMPLALELAAAWRKALPCRDIADEIRRGLGFLASDARNVEQRHHSIQTVFDQTWQRLSEREQAVFMRLSVFRGGIQRAAIVEVTGATLPILSALVDKSLVRLDSRGRYQVHELLRQYAAEQLEKSPESTRQAQAAHAAYYIRFLHERKQAICGGGQREALLQIKAEMDNLRVAWLWAVAQADAGSLAAGSEALGLYYQFLGGYLEGATLFAQATRALEAGPRSQAAYIALLGTQMYEAWYHLRFGRLEGVEACMAASLAVYRRLNIPPLPGYLTDPHAPLSFVALTRGDYAAALAFAEQVAAVAEAERHPINCQFAYHLLAEAQLGMGAYEAARTSAEKAYAQALLTGDQWFMAYILINRGRIAVALGDTSMGKAHFRASYEIRETFKDPEGMALASTHLGNVALQERDLAAAEEHYGRSQAIYADINDKGGLAAASWGAGRVACALGDFPASQSYFKQALQLALEIDYRPVLFGLLVSVAELLWQLGQRERSLSLLALTLHHPATDNETKKKARGLVTDTYQKTVPAAVFAAAIAEGEAADLGRLTTDLLQQLSIAPAVPATQARGEFPAALVEPLTVRELDVLGLICQGLTNDEIGRALGIATGTVKFYTGQIYGKLGARNRVAAVARARELNLVQGS